MTREGPQRIGAQDIRPYDGFGSFATEVAEAIRPCASAAPEKEIRTYILALHWRHPRQETGRNRRTEESRRDRCPERVRAAAMVEAAGVADE